MTLTARLVPFHASSHMSHETDSRRAPSDARVAADTTVPTSAGAAP
ncbi:hypothetical protein SAMN02745121_06370 [Nannocystis exedens]|uniref:Uncharacterized protein n=1 Tax=Nannocystis exedens TaxID=54 RepID=A0A1I2EZS5_9BACT|nr:hypothetical protein NAEX_02585 [Nannocystis exedens]SFE98385.1 hypothetical protein SAMN02745121_06370 [Nannocystis exedens]